MIRKYSNKSFLLALGYAACIALAGCGPDKQGGAAVPKPNVVSLGAQTGAPPLFSDITEKAGIRFVYQSSKTPRKYLVETMGSGCAFIDYDGDGWQDTLL